MGDGPHQGCEGSGVKATGHGCPHSARFGSSHTYISVRGMADRRAALGTTTAAVGPHHPHRALAFAVRPSSVCREGSFSGK